MQYKPLVSILTPCYNSEKWVERYLTSIYNQTYTNIELIVVNDGSSDQTERIVLSYQDKFEAKGLTLVYQYQENKGLGGAINTGLKLIRGKYFTWCDSDNFYTNDYVETKVNFFETHPEFDIVRCDGIIVNDSDIGRPVQLMSKGNTDKYRQKLFLNALETKNFHFGCAMLKTEAFDKINPAREIYPSREGQNWQLLLPMFYHYRSGYIDRPMFYFVMRKDSISNCTSQKGLREKINQIDEYVKIITETLAAMHLDEKENQRYLTLVNKKYASAKLNLAASCRDISLLDSQYHLMKRNRLASPKDSLRYFFSRYLAGSFLGRFCQRLRHSGTIPAAKNRGGISVINKPDCTGCHACASICPQNCIEMSADREGFLYPKADASQCVNCGLCEKVCPVSHPMMKTPHADAYAAYSKDEKLREDSSSGGIFTLIANYILENGGVVFGAEFDRDFNVIHGVAETKEELSGFRGSKYVQSEIGDAFERAKTFLDQGRWVLFSGTPCQIAGFKSYLPKEYPYLFCQDIVCHGVPSPKVWRKYVDYRQKAACSPVQSISFRKKTAGWRDFSVSFTFQNDLEQECCHREDLMMRAFLSNLCLRPSCHRCSFKGQNGQSDITLADFWGIEKVLPEMDDNKGISLISIHSENGKKLWEAIKNKTVYQSVDGSDYLKYNSAAILPAKPHKNRTAFFRHLNSYEFDRLIKRYECSPLTKLKKHIWTYLRK